jgi:hypothetical protein
MQNLNSTIYLNVSPFYENLIYDPNSRAIRTIAFMDPDVVNTKVRSEFILNEFKSLVENFERASGADAKISGMPYIKLEMQKL